jgi:hypothetical protein
MNSRRFLTWSFNHYLEIAHPRFAGLPSPGSGKRALQHAA